MDQVWLPTPRAGDRVLIGNAGVYATCYSGRSAFNGYPAPAVKPEFRIIRGFWRYWAGKFAGQWRAA